MVLWEKPVPQETVGPREWRLVEKICPQPDAGSQGKLIPSHVPICVRVRWWVALHGCH